VFTAQNARVKLRDVAAMPVSSLWQDIAVINQSGERVSFPTQKPVTLFNA
jgi:hypothetical protein